MEFLFFGLTDCILLMESPSRLNKRAFSPALTGIPTQNFGHPSQRKGKVKAYSL